MVTFATAFLLPPVLLNRDKKFMPIDCGVESGVDLTSFPA